MNQDLYPLLADILERQERISLAGSGVLPPKYRKLDPESGDEIYSLQDVWIVKPQFLKRAAILVPLFLKKGTYHLLLNQTGGKTRTP